MHIERKANTMGNPELRPKLRLIALILLLVAGALLAACEDSELRTGWSGSHTSGHMDYSYNTFSGDEVGRATLDEGEELTVEYDAEVDKGTLTIRVEDPDGDTLQAITLEEDDSDTWTITASQDGQHIVVVEGDDTGGSFDVEWDPADDVFETLIYVAVGVIAAIVIAVGAIVFLVVHQC